MDTYVHKAVLLNLSYYNYVKLALIDDIPCISETTYRRNAKILQNQIANLYYNELNSIITNIKDKKLTIAIDTRWSSRGYIATESTTTIFSYIEDRAQYELLWTENLIKRGLYSNFNGSSKGMEKEGTESN